MTKRRGPRNDEEEGPCFDQKAGFGNDEKGAPRHDKKVELPHPKSVIGERSEAISGVERCMSRSSKLWGSRLFQVGWSLWQAEGNSRQGS